MTILGGIARTAIPIGVKGALLAGVWYVGPATLIATVGIVPVGIAATFVFLGGVDLITNMCI